MLRPLTFFIVAFVTLVLGSYQYNYNSRPAAKGLRSEAPGTFVQLSQGAVHYELSGPDDGPVVVLIHGMSTPSFVWDHNVAALNAAGFRVLRYDLYGRGYSDRPDAHHTYALYDEQLLELLEALAIPGPVDLVGLSMGGATATIFTDRHPEKVRKVALLAPLALPLGERSLLERLFLAPVIGDYVAELFGENYILHASFNEIRDRRLHGGFVSKLEPQLHIRGTSSAMLDSARNLPDAPRIAAYERLGNSARPQLIIWGTEDPVLPYSLSPKLRELLPNASFHEIKGTGHLPAYEQPDQVNTILIDFLAD